MGRQGARAEDKKGGQRGQTVWRPVADITRRERETQLRHRLEAAVTTRGVRVIFATNVGQP